jgi:hypothetical protein
LEKELFAPMMRQAEQNNLSRAPRSTTKPGQYGWWGAVIAGFAGVALIGQAVSSNLQGTASKEKELVARATPAPVASAKDSVLVTSPKEPKPYQRYANNPQLASQRLAEIARQSKGDWNKVSWDDQVFINRMSQGHGPQMLQQIAQRTGAKK